MKGYVGHSIHWLASEKSMTKRTLFSVPSGFSTTKALGPVIKKNLQEMEDMKMVNIIGLRIIIRTISPLWSTVLKQVLSLSFKFQTELFTKQDNSCA